MSLLEKLKQDIHYQEGLNSCMNCGVCTAICPAAEFYKYDPRMVVETVQRGKEEEIKALIEGESIWYCGECMSCKTRCPRGNTPGLIIMALRKLSQEEEVFTKSEKGSQQFFLGYALGENMLKNGYCVTPDLVKPEMHPEQGPVWEWIYNNRDAFYDRVHSNYKKTGAGTLRRVDDESLKELNDIFEVTGGKAFLEKIDRTGMRKAAEKGISPTDFGILTYTSNNGTHTEE